MSSCLAILLGLVLAQHDALHSILWLWLAAPLVYVVGRKNHGFILLILLVVVCGGLGLWRGTQYVQKMVAYDQLNKQKVTLVGIAQSDAVYGKQYQLTFDVVNATVIVPHEVHLFGTLTISGFGESAIFKGDTVQITGSLWRTQGNNVALISYGQLHVLAHHTTLIDTIRRKFDAGLQSALPEPAASFGLGLLIGQRNTLPSTISQQLMMVGLTHIIAVSGYNLTIMLRAAGKLLGKRSKYQYLCFSVLLILLFLLFAGTSPSIVRASAVCGLGLAAWYYGRAVKPIVLLMVSASATAYLNPLYAWGNVSWYLSFLAFFGVLVVSPIVTKRLYGDREPGLVQAVMLESLCAEAMTLPYVLFIFGQMSTVGVLANVLVAAMTPVAMLLTLVAGLGGMLFSAYAGWVAWPAKMVLTYMLDISHILSRIPHAFLQHIGFSLKLFVTSYGIVSAVLMLMWRRGHRKYAIITDKTDPMRSGP